MGENLYPSIDYLKELITILKKEFPVTAKDEEKLLQALRIVYYPSVRP